MKNCNAQFAGQHWDVKVVHYWKQDTMWLSTYHFLRKEHLYLARDMCVLMKEQIPQLERVIGMEEALLIVEKFL